MRQRVLTISAQTIANRFPIMLVSPYSQLLTEIEHIFKNKGRTIMKRLLQLSCSAALITGSLGLTTKDAFAQDQAHVADSRCACICNTTCDQFNCPTADIATSARVVAIKALNRMPVDPNKDFPRTIAQFTDNQRELYRQEFAKNIACVFGCPVGWKLALGTASPTTPALGYTKPCIGQLFSRMNINSSEARVTSQYAIGATHETDLIFRVSNEAINNATTASDIIQNIDAIIPYIELPALYVQTLAELSGPAAPFFGNGLLTPLNGATRLGLLGTPIPVPGTRTIDQWTAVLSRVTGTEETITSNGTITRPFNQSNFITFALTLIRLLHENGITVKKGDLLSLGNLTGVNLFQPNELELKSTYNDIDPNGPVTMRLIVDDAKGLCIGDPTLCESSNSIVAFIAKKFCAGANS